MTQGSKCIICDIINGDLKSYIVYEDELFIAFLDIKPLFIGHCLLAPKSHYHTINDLPSTTGNSFLSVIQKLSKAITNAMQAEGSFIAINNKVSQSIEHLHVHLVPRKKGDGLKGFFWPRNKYKSEAQMQATKNAIKEKIEK